MPPCTTGLEILNTHASKGPGLYFYRLIEPLATWNSSQKRHDDDDLGTSRHDDDDDDHSEAQRLEPSVHLGRIFCGVVVAVRRGRLININNRDRLVVQD